MHYIGLQGMPRRVADYAGRFADFNLFISIASFGLGASTIVFLYNMIWSWTHGPPAGPNPWRAMTLEWQVPLAAADLQLRRDPAGRRRPVRVRRPRRAPRDLRRRQARARPDRLAVRRGPRARDRERDRSSPALLDALRERAAQRRRHVTVIAPVSEPRRGYVVYDDTRRASAGRRLEKTLRCCASPRSRAGLRRRDEPRAGGEGRARAARAAAGRDHRLDPRRRSARAGCAATSSRDIDAAAGGRSRPARDRRRRGAGRRRRTCSWSRTRPSLSTRAARSHPRARGAGPRELPDRRAAERRPSPSPEADRRLRRALSELRVEGIDAHGQVVASRSVHGCARTRPTTSASTRSSSRPSPGDRSGWLRRDLSSVCAARRTCRSTTWWPTRERRSRRARRTAPARHGDANLHPPPIHYSSRISPAIVGIFLFIGSEIMLFGSFFTVYFFDRVVNNPHALAADRPRTGIRSSGRGSSRSSTRASSSPRASRCTGRRRR